MLHSHPILDIPKTRKEEKTTTKMKNEFSVVMFVSRNNSKSKRAIESVAMQEPDEFRAYLDTVALDQIEQEEIRVALKDANATILSQQSGLSEDRFHNFVLNVYRAYSQVTTSWFTKVDDDDLMIGKNRHEVIDSFGKSEIAIIHGDKRVNYPNWQYLKSAQIIQLGKSLVKPKIFRGRQCNSAYDIHRKIWEPTAMIRHKAYKQISACCQHDGPSIYFYDREIIFWLLQSGWKSAYVPEVLYFQNVNAYPEKERKQYWGKWDIIVRETLDKINIQL